MRLTKLEISNYRGMDSLAIDLDPSLTVLVAPNGGGKTTVLNALRVAVWPFVKGFDLGSQTGKGATIQIADVRLSQQENGNMEPCLPCCIKAHGVWGDSNNAKTWIQTRERIKRNTNTLGDKETKKLISYAQELEGRVRDGRSDVALPLITYLSVSRFLGEGRFTSIAEDVTLNKEDYSRTSGYLNCLSVSSSFKAFTAWYGWVFRSYREEQIKALEKDESLSEIGERFFTLLGVVQHAIDTLVQKATGWHSLEYKASQNQQLVMQHDELGTLPVDMLSDGICNTVALVADIAFRCAKLNPHLGAKAALQTPGIALIDEVDMFLHPSWQQTILASLQEAFPRIQFVVSTHSPQVLTTVNRKNIRVLGPNIDGGWQAVPPRQEVKGVESSVALAETMNVDPIPPVQEAKWLDEYTAMIERGNHESAEGKTLRNTIEEIYGKDHQLLINADRLIRFQQFKLKKFSKE